MDPRWAVYCHTHRETGRRYVGLTKKTMMQRWNNHVLNAVRKPGKGCHHFWSAIRKYGKDSFDHQVIQTCPSLEEAGLWEDFWIEFLDTRNPERGFNLQPGGYRLPLNPGALRAKLSAASRSMWSRPGERGRVSERLKARELTPEGKATRAKVTASMRGRPKDPAAVAKTAAALRGRPLSPAHREAIGRAGTGRKLSPEHAAKSVAACVKHHAAWKVRTHCKHGHPLADAYTRGNGRRMCRACVKLRNEVRERPEPKPTTRHQWEVSQKPGRCVKCGTVRRYTFRAHFAYVNSDGVETDSAPPCRSAAPPVCVA